MKVVVTEKAYQAIQSRAIGGLFITQSPIVHGDMREITLDEDTYAYLKSNSLPDENISDAIVRLLEVHNEDTP